MNFFEKRQAIKFIEKYRARLPKNLKDDFEEWEKIRDIIAKEMNLSEEQIINITKRTIAYAVANNIKNELGVKRDQNVIISVAKTKGTTAAIEEAAELAKIAKEYKEKCNSFFDKFSQRYNEIKSNKKKPRR